jgi:nitrogen fixation/metabolism regulation signal transduction histidine kinase
LLSNAFKFTIKGSIGVIIELRVIDNQIIVKIKDTGIGIHPNILPKLFTKFATKSDTGGTVGLFISKSIIEKHVVEYGLRIIPKMEIQVLFSHLVCPSMLIRIKCGLNRIRILKH